MQSFLEEVTEYVLEHYPGKTGNICLVTPNRRAGLFFRKYIGSRVDRPIWSPDILSIEDFMNRVSGLRIVDQTSLLFQFYEVYLQVEGSQAQPLDDFLKWAPVFLADIDEVDASLADPDSLFDYLRDVRRIEAWSPDGAPLTTFQKKYLAFFERMKTYYEHLRQHLLTRDMAYQGLSARMAAQKLEGGLHPSPWEKVLFIGFNALTRAEEHMVMSLFKAGKAEYLVDADNYYLRDAHHEAGMFIRKYAQKFGLNTSFIRDHLEKGHTQIHILGIAKNVNQARLAGNILLQYNDIARDVQTAIVLANESLLIPMLNSLPADTEHVNVTMGYPLTKTNMYGFFEAVWKLLHSMNPGAAGSSTGAAGTCYHKDIIKLLGHSSAAMLWDPMDGQQAVSDLIQKIKLSNRTFLTCEDISSMTDDPDIFLQAFWFLTRDYGGQPERLPGDLTELCARLDKAFRMQAESKGVDLAAAPWFADFESLYYFSGMFRRIQGFVERHPFLLSVKMMYSLFRQLATEARLSFSGEPLQGLQLMGMLETRNLDFKHVILLSANEHILPRPRNNQSFIPYDIKSQFGLMVHADQDAIYAYHFYHLLHRAEKVFIIYNTQTEDIGSSERSRYVTQLLMELRHKAPHVHIAEHIVTVTPVAPQAGLPLVVEKTPEIMEVLHDQGRYGFSPSALNTYINCPLQYYYQRILHIEEPTEVEESVEAATMGSVVHEVLEKLYKPFAGQLIGPDVIASFMSQCTVLTEASYRSLYRGGDLSRGKNLLLMHLTQRFIHNFLASEKRFLEQHVQEGLHIVALEQGLEAVVPIEVRGRKTDVKIRGKADRIDAHKGIHRVIDYKTGKLKYDELKIRDWDAVTRHSKYAKVFQLLAYAYMYRQSIPATTDVVPGIFSMREPGRGLQTLVFPDDSGIVQPQHLDTFSEGLQALLRDILDPEVPFTQTPEEQNCSYCPFRISCGRHGS